VCPLVVYLRLKYSQSAHGVGARFYNRHVPASSPKPQLEPALHKPHARSIHTLEATGLLVIALVVLVVYVARYWHHIPWSAR
jgi:hypothetical protein